MRRILGTHTSQHAKKKIANIATKFCSIAATLIRYYMCYHNVVATITYVSKVDSFYHCCNVFAALCCMGSNAAACDVLPLSAPPAAVFEICRASRREFNNARNHSQKKKKKNPSPPYRGNFRNLDSRRLQRYLIVGWRATSI